MTNLRALARLAGVHPSTVSRALRDDQRISPALRRRLRQLAQDTGYRPHRAAQQLVGRRCQTIHLACRSLTDPPQARWVMACIEQARASGLDLLLTADAGDPARARHDLDRLAPGRADGLLLLPAAASLCTSELSRLLHDGLRLVAVGHVPPHLDIPCICDDDGAAAEALVTALAARGCRRICCALSAGSSSGANRLAAARWAAKRQGLPLMQREPESGDDGNLALLTDDRHSAVAIAQRLGERATRQLHIALYGDPVDHAAAPRPACASLIGLRRDEHAWAERAIACLRDPTLPGSRLAPQLCSG